jgi:hypothetical protein
MYFIYIVSLFIFTLFFRSTVRIFYPRLIDYDTYFHVFMIDFIRNNGTSNMIEYKRFIKPSGMNYPWMIHWILSLFPKKFDSFLERFFNPFLDAIFVVVLYLVTFYLTSSNEKSLLLCLLYIFTPATFSILGTGPRIKSFTPRLFGEIVGSLVFIFEYLYLESGDFLFLGLAIFFASIVFLASKFAVQAIVFINIPLILFNQNYELISIVFIGFMLAIIYSRGKYWDILKQQTFHLVEYFLENLKGKMEVSGRNNFKILFRAIKERNKRKIISFMLFSNSYFILFYKIPIVCMALYYIVINGTYNSNESIFLFSAIFIFLIVSLKWFLFIGEAERYLNYVLFFSCLILVDNNIDEFILYGLILYGLIYYYFDFLLIKFTYRKLKTENDIVIDWLNQLEGNLNVGTVPYGLGGWRIVTDTNHNRLYGMVYVDKKERDKINEFQVRHPILDINQAEEMFLYYNLDYLIYNKNYLHKENIKYQVPNGFKKININENLIALYK